MMEETKNLPTLLFHRILIDEICKINFEVVSGEMFSIVSPPTVSCFGLMTLVIRLIIFFSCSLAG